MKEAEKNKTSFTILTPSGFKLEAIQSESLREKIRVFFADQAEIFPAKAEPGIVQIVKTGSLPHRTFVGLMALSEAPPIVAGDGAMSAAIEVRQWEAASSSANFHLSTLFNCQYGFAKTVSP